MTYRNYINSVCISCAYFAKTRVSNIMKKDKYVVFLPKSYGIFTGKGANLAHSRTLAEKYEFVWENIFYFHFPLQSSKYPDLLTTMLSSCHTLY